MSFNLSKKAISISPSVTLEITAKAQELKSKGIDIIGFGAGEPDFNTPDNIQNVGIKAIKEGKTRYTATSGIPELKKAICNKLKVENGLEYEPENILVSSGAKHSIFNAFYAILNPGDEVIIPVPYWVSYPEFVKLSDGVPVYVETKEENNFKYDIKELEKAITKKTKAIILNSPSNPTGTVYTKEELESIADLAVRNNIFIISDEIYEKLIYDNENHISIASLNEEIKDLTIVINGMSKAYAMTGWRIGYAAAHKDIVKVMTNLQSHMTSNPTSISQYASVEALEGDQEVIGEMKKHFEERRNFMVDKINSIKYLSCKNPKGAFYIMANISQVKGKTIKGRLINDSLDFTKLLLEEANVAIVPGIAFGADDFIRLSYATSIDNIKEGLERIERILE
ncbi:aspartate aminotransferase [Gottschalkia purinilytica]|uniref:Aminotransferase n=1 Tax=Gottschalkia purinilytica TaxID=1503 RepID=A0A0L0WBL6_GOTPU|nr:pyridoxal phosphate-dependent aminotransferase [Gottschalkia purinilytica]KNF08888.1 aspartate aminotransferase [Gottschalkia purinilytica]